MATSPDDISPAPESSQPPEAAPARNAARSTPSPPGVKSTASIIGHPIHPMLIPFPIAFLMAALVTDIVAWVQGDPFWARASMWLLVAGLCSGALAAIPGLVDFLSIRLVRAHRAGWIHLGGNVLVLLVALANLMTRIPEPVDRVAPSGIILSVVTVILLGVTGWYGGELAYRHGIGVHRGDE